MLSLFYRIPERNGQTERRTDRFAISISRVSMLTRGKNSLAADSIFCSYVKKFDHLMHRVLCKYYLDFTGREMNTAHYYGNSCTSNIQRWERTLTARVRFCSGSNKSKGSVWLKFFTSAENLCSVRIRFFILSFEFGSMSVRLFDSFKFNCISVITKSFNAICKLM